MPGFAVVDLETTGIHPGRHERVVEVAVVHVSPGGEITGAWETLVNPGRDLGPQRIHRVRGADVLRAPTFAQIGCSLVELLRGRVLVAHNLRFDAGFLAAEYERCGHHVPLDGGLCTMSLARRYLPGSGRSLAECCGACGIPLVDAHRASADAMAAAQLLVGYLEADSAATHWGQSMARATSAGWPALPPSVVDWSPREHAEQRENHFLARLVDRLPDDGLPDLHAAYLATLDQALLDRHISLTEADGLVAVASELGIGRAAARALNDFYLTQLATVAWADGVITDDERADLHAVGALLEMRSGRVDELLDDARGVAHDPGRGLGAFALAAADLVVFTGEMSRERSEWESTARALGLVPHRAVTKAVKLVVAGDPDTLSGKARKARDYGIPIVAEEHFACMVASLPTPSPSR